ncbi:MAG: hypothetical protein VYD85_01100, partial [Pseudomonadota bacterium]|nr:hypothetical protein [Pseudomonadota bacterium]
MAEEIVEPDLFDDPFDSPGPEATIEASERAIESFSMRRSSRRATCPDNPRHCHLNLNVNPPRYEPH